MIALPEKLSMPLLQVSKGTCFKIYLLSDENSAFFRKKNEKILSQLIMRKNAPINRLRMCWI